MLYFVFNCGVYPVRIHPEKGRIRDLEGIEFALEGSNVYKVFVVKEVLRYMDSVERICGLFRGSWVDNQIRLEDVVVDYSEIQQINEVLVYDCNEGVFRRLLRGEYDSRTLVTFVGSTPDVYFSWEQFVEGVKRLVE